MLASSLGGATIGAFVVVAVVVLALAGYLLAVIGVLKKTTNTLDGVLNTVNSIASQTAPVSEVVSGILTNLGDTQNALRGVLGLGFVGRRGRTPGPAPVIDTAGGTGPVSIARNPLRAPGARSRR